jgi:endonuclease YncB( thermonuclease family)
MRRLLLLAILALLPCTARADFVGRVVKVSDGDSLVVRVETKEVKVRLDSIDAPELRQPFGKQSQASLAQLCAARTARVLDRGLDRYGRTIGLIECDGVDANAEQVRRGMAWVFERYAPRNSPLYGLQGEARGSRRGLWADPHPTAPWQWRLRPALKPSAKRPQPEYRG